MTERAIERGEFNVTLDTIVKIARRAAGGHTLKTFNRLCRPRRGAVSLNPCPSVDDSAERGPVDGGIANILGEFLEKPDLRDVTIVTSDWGGPQLLVGGKWDDRLARLVICNCEAFDNVPPPGAARGLPYIARIPGGITTALRRALEHHRLVSGQGHGTGRAHVADPGADSAARLVA